MLLEPARAVYFYFTFVFFFLLESDRMGQQVRLPKERLNSTASRKIGDDSVCGVLMSDFGGYRGRAHLRDCLEGPAAHAC